MPRCRQGGEGATYLGYITTQPDCEGVSSVSPKLGKSQEQIPRPGETRPDDNPGQPWQRPVAGGVLTPLGQLTACSGWGVGPMTLPGAPEALRGRKGHGVPVQASCQPPTVAFAGKSGFYSETLHS